MSHKFFFEIQIYKKISPKLWLSYLLTFQKRFAKTIEFRPSKEGPCLKGLGVVKRPKKRTLSFFFPANLKNIKMHRKLLKY